MPLHSSNQRLALLGDVPAHIFWGFRSYLDFIAEHGQLDIPIVIADKGFIDRSKTVFSVNQDWGRLGRFVVNGGVMWEPPPFREELPDAVLELGQDESDFSFISDSDGYANWLEQWPDRFVRVHPKVERATRPLEADLAEAGLVVGLNTSALVAASMAGCLVQAFGDHSMAKGIDEVRSDRLRWLRSIEFDRRDPAQVEAIAAVLADPGRAAVCPEGTPQTPASTPKSRKKRGKKKPARQARGKPSGRSVASSDESDGI